jgi:hypothetical protein
MNEIADTIDTFKLVFSLSFIRKNSIDMILIFAIYYMLLSSLL